MEFLYALLALFCLILLPIGLIKPSIITRFTRIRLNRPFIAVLCIGGFILFTSLGANSPSYKASLEKDKKETITPPIETTLLPTTASVAPTTIEKFNVVVTSQIVKKVNGKYRYFFDIRNKDTKNFEGNVYITLFTNTLKNPLASDTFNSNKPIEPNLGTSVYVDANTGPTSEHGENGITKFKYTVKMNNNIVNSGEGNISDKFENTDAYTP